MTEKQKYAILIIFFIHSVVSIIGTRRLRKSVILTSRQKKVYLLLLWLIPFLWFLFVNAIHKKTPGSHEVPVKDDVSNNPFHESGMGAPDTNIKN